MEHHKIPISGKHLLYNTKDHLMYCLGYDSNSSLLTILVETYDGVE